MHITLYNMYILYTVAFSYYSILTCTFDTHWIYEEIYYVIQS